MGADGAHPDTGRADLRLHELVPEYGPQIHGERARLRVCSYGKRDKYDLCRSGERSRTRRPVDRKRGMRWGDSARPHFADGACGGRGREELSTEKNADGRGQTRHSILRAMNGM